MMRAARGGRLLTTAAMAAAVALGVAASGLAQDATPTASDAAVSAYANSLHQGTCDELNPTAVEELANLEFPAWVATLTADGGAMDATLGDPADLGNAPIPVAAATTDVQIPLADIVSGGHALSVLDAMDASISVACGNIGGMADENGDLFVGLDAVDDSGYSGVAWLHDNGISTTVVVFLSHPAQQDLIEANLAALVTAAAAAAESTPEAAPAATPEAAPEGTPVA